MHEDFLFCVCIVSGGTRGVGGVGGGGVWPGWGAGTMLCLHDLHGHSAQLAR